MLYTYDNPEKFAKELADNVFNNYILRQYYIETEENQALSRRGNKRKMSYFHKYMLGLLAINLDCKINYSKKN